LELYVVLFLTSLEVLRKNREKRYFQISGVVEKGKALILRKAKTL